MEDKILYYVVLPYACYAIYVSNNIVTETPPIVRWMEGRTLSNIKRWVKRKKGSMEKVI